MATRLSSSRKIVSLQRLFTLRKAWSRRGKRVVFTNGVFDILHAGHVELLEKARALGHVLVVGVNSDGSAQRLDKGPGRPFNSLKDRAQVLASLSCVDAVASFAEDTPERLLARLRPDIMVKGSDYRPEEVAGRHYARKLVLLRLKQGYSTTNLAVRIAKALRP